MGKDKDLGSLKEDIQWNKSTLWKVLKTTFFVLVWLTNAMYSNITGPTLIDLKIRTNSNYEDVAVALSGRNLGFFIGSVLGGVLVDKFGLYCDLIIAVCFDFSAMVTIAIPWAPDSQLILFLCTMSGIFEGIINIAAQKVLIEMWRDKVSSPLHVCHGGYGTGSILISLIAKPFLAIPLHKNENNITAGNYTALYVFVPNTTTDTVETITGAPMKEVEYLQPSRIEYAYLISTAAATLMSFVFYGYHCLDSKGRKSLRTYNQKKSENKTKSERRVATIIEDTKRMLNPATCAAGNFVYGLQIFALLFLFFFHTVGGESVGGKFVRAFSIDYYAFSTDEGTDINTYFWVSFTVGRFFGFLTARWIPIRILILLETGFVLVTSIFLAIFGGSSSTALWVLMQPVGFFMAPLYPSGVGWGNHHVHMTGIGITVLLLGGGVGGVVYMKLIGYLYDNYGPKTFLWTLLGYGIAVFLNAVLLDIAGARHKQIFDKSHKDGQEVNEEEDEKLVNGTDKTKDGLHATIHNGTENLKESLHDTSV